jgi:GNAT superfamily N-acetyltransferase
LKEIRTKHGSVSKEETKITRPYFIWRRSMITFREARKEDVSLILSFIKKLAIYEKMIDQVQATEETLFQSIFKNKQANVYFILKNEKEIGFAVTYHQFSTFVGKSGLFLEDIFIDEKERHQGYGKLFFKYLMQVALDNDYERFEWNCLDWNQPSIDFYLSLGAKPLSDWTTYRLTTHDMKTFIQKK